MNDMTDGKFMAVFQQIIAAFCVLMIDSCILLFFSILASKSLQSLIVNKTAKTNQIQTNVDSNGAIAPFEFSSASKQSRKKTNLFKRKSAIKNKTPVERALSVNG